MTMHRGGNLDPDAEGDRSEDQPVKREQGIKIRRTLNSNPRILVGRPLHTQAEGRAINSTT